MSSNRHLVKLKIDAILNNLASQKKIGLIILFGTFLSVSFSQGDWRKEISNPNSNFFTIQQSFENEFGNQPYTKGLGIKQFRRWEYYWEKRVDENGNFPSQGQVLNEMQAWYSNHPTPKGYVSGSGTWMPLGPYGVPNNGTGQMNGNGRVGCIQFHPTDPNIMYTGAPSGGFWRSDDGGTSWSEFSTGLVRLGVSSIAINPVSPNLIYIGTGDRDGGDAPGYGVWRSTDGGNTWAAHNSGMGNRTINELLIDPNNPSIMLAAGSNGRIYRTINAGSTWVQSAALGMNPKDIAYHPSNSSIVYAAGDEFHKSVDGGITWTQITSGVPSAQRIAIAVSPDQPNWVYILAGNGSGLVGISRSTDSGTSFSLRTNSPNILDYSTAGSGNASQAWYDLVIAADPTNADIIYTGGINIWKSTDGGLNMNCMSYWVGQSGSIDGVHADQHVLEFSPYTNDLFNGNDGGIYKTINGGTDWLDVSQGLGIAQLYKLGVSQQTEDLVINGYQDNGTGIFDNGSFTTEIGGDGMECIIDHSDDSYMYGALYYGDIRRSTNGGNNFSSIANGVSENGAWVTPYKLDPNDPNRMLAGYINIWRNTSVQSGNTWTQISNFGGSSKITDICVAPSNSDIVYVSRKDNTFRRSNNATSASPTWTNLTSGLPVNNEPADIEVDPNDPTHLYAAIGNNIYESSNSGSSWTDISGTLPNISLNTIVIDQASTASAMYVGMDVGVYYKDDNLSDWVIYNSGLANVEVTELEIHYGSGCGGVLYASTYGQGTWKSDLKDPGNLAPLACFSASPNVICESEVLMLIDESSFSPASWTWTISPATFTFVGGTNSNSQNPQVQFSSPGNYDIQLSATNGNGTDVLLKTAIVSVSASAAACDLNDDFESYSACGIATDCGATTCPLGGFWENRLNGTQDDIDWRIDDGGTASANTGPSVDFNPGTTAGNYLYLEASGGCTAQEAILESSCVYLNQNYNFNYRYHMYGTAMGSIHLDVFSGGAWINDIIPQVSGNQGDVWNLASVDLSSFTGQAIKLRLRGETGNGFESDIALDDFYFAPAPIGPLNISSCGAYTSPSGNYTWVSDGIYSDTLVTATGCDSITMYNLQIGSSSASSSSVSACGSYTWTLDGNTYNSGGAYTTTIPNASGCDSVVTLNLTINNATSSTETVSSCETYTWLADGLTYNTTGTYTTTLTNSLGCDSIITLNLTINNTTSSSEIVTSCDDYTWLTSGTTYTSSGTYTELLTNSNGCDSIVTLDLTINSSSAINQLISECNSYTWPVNGNTYTSSGIFTETFSNSNGCDSILTLDLTILNGSIFTETVSACDDYFWSVTGITYTNSGSFTENLISQQGCDSVVTLNLTIETIDIGTSTSGTTISANQSNASYVWLDCSDYTAISGANGQNYTPTINGQYAVVVSQNSCIDTSTCIAINFIGILENQFKNLPIVYPNPTQGEVSIDLGEIYTEITISIKDASGKLIQEFMLPEGKLISFDLNQPAGIYLIHISSHESNALVKILKE